MLQLDKVTVRFGGLTAVNDVSLKIEGQQIVGLVGPNGAGKTTLFNVISGLVRPTSGRVLFNGEDIVRQPLYRRARIGLGRTFQIPQPMHELTVVRRGGRPFGLLFHPHRPALRRGQGQ